MKKISKGRTRTKRVQTAPLSRSPDAGKVHPKEEARRRSTKKQRFFFSECIFAASFDFCNSTSSNSSSNSSNSSNFAVSRVMNDLLPAQKIHHKREREKFFFFSFVVKTLLMFLLSHSANSFGLHKKLFLATAFTGSTYYREEDIGEGGREGGKGGRR